MQVVILLIGGNTDWAKTNYLIQEGETKTLTTHTDGGNWLALSNPYTFKLDVSSFLSEHGDIKG